MIQPAGLWYPCFSPQNNLGRTISEDAFAELAKRHVNLLYSAALRQVGGDAHLAQDVAQTVLADLARKAGSLSRRESLTGWLYTSAHFAAAKMARAENRRRDREERFMREPTNESVATADWEQIRPLLDDAMHWFLNKHPLTRNMTPDLKFPWDGPGRLVMNTIPTQTAFRPRAAATLRQESRSLSAPREGAPSSYLTVAAGRTGCWWQT